jgi:hypothetical protein
MLSTTLTGSTSEGKEKPKPAMFRYVMRRKKKKDMSCEGKESKNLNHCKNIFIYINHSLFLDHLSKPGFVLRENGRK